MNVNIKQVEIDAAGQILGRLASTVAQMLQGKQSAGYNPRLVGDTRVVVINASKIKVTGKKAEQKMYYHHTGYQGHLREKVYKEMQAQNPVRVVEWAVYNMLPKNRLRPTRMKRLTIKA